MIKIWERKAVLDFLKKEPARENMSNLQLTKKFIKKNRYLFDSSKIIYKSTQSSKSIKEHNAIKEEYKSYKRGCAAAFPLNNGGWVGIITDGEGSVVGANQRFDNKPTTIQILNNLLSMELYLLNKQLKNQLKEQQQKEKSINVIQNDKRFHIGNKVKGITLTDPDIHYSSGVIKDININTGDVEVELVVKGTQLLHSRPLKASRLARYLTDVEPTLNHTENYNDALSR